MKWQAESVDTQSTGIGYRLVCNNFFVYTSILIYEMVEFKLRLICFGVWVDGIIGKNEIKTERISWGSESKIANGKNTEFINRRSKLMND